MLALIDHALAIGLGLLQAARQLGHAPGGLTELPPHVGQIGLRLLGGPLLFAREGLGHARRCLREGLGARPRQPPFDYGDIKAPVDEQVGGRVADAPIPAIGDVVPLRRQAGGLVAQGGKRQIDAALQMAGLVLHRRTHVQPDSAVAHPRFSLVKAQGAGQGTLHEIDEMRLAEPQQHPVGQHRHIAVARLVRQQRLLAEAVAGTQLGQLDRTAAVARVPGHRTATLMDQIEIVALIALADDQIPGLGGDLLHRHHHPLDVGRGDLLEDA